MQTPYRQVRAFGSRATAAIESGAAVTLDTNTATVTVTVEEGQEPSEIAGLARLVAAEVLSHLGTMLLEIADAEGKRVSTEA